MSLLPVDSNVFLDLHQYYHQAHSEHSAPRVIVSVMSDVNIFATKLQCEYKLFQFFLVVCNVHFVYSICKTHCEWISHIKENYWATSEFSNFSILVLSTVFAQIKEAIGDYFVAFWTI